LPIAASFSRTSVPSKSVSSIAHLHGRGWRDRSTTRLVWQLGGGIQTDLKRQQTASRRKEAQIDWYLTRIEGDVQRRPFFFVRAVPTLLLHVARPSA
jgi:hypothetical protein